MNALLQQMEDMGNKQQKEMLKVKKEITKGWIKKRFDYWSVVEISGLMKKLEGLRG